MPTRRFVILGLAAAALLSAACSSSAGGDTTSNVANSRDGVVSLTIADHTGAPFTKSTIDVKRVASIRAEVPAAIRDAGELKIGVGALPSGYPPLVFVGTDQHTLTGSEVDLGRAVAAVLGLKPVISNYTWENLFVGIDSGRVDAGFSNITDTEERKKKYDFATYRKDNLGFEVLAKNTWSFAGDYHNLAGLTVAVGAGTNQEKLLQEWQRKLKAQGKTLSIKEFPDSNAVNLALSSGRIDAYFAPNPGIQYHIAQVAKSASPTRSAGTFSGAGETLQGLIAATTKKGNGLVTALRDALQELIHTGRYAQILKAYNLTNESIAGSKINPPGLPVTNS